MISLSSSSVSLSEDPGQIGKGISLITVLDINDNAPEFAIDYETLLCENTLPGQVSPLLVFPSSVKPQRLFLFTWMFTHKDNPLTMITMIKSLFFLHLKEVQGASMSASQLEVILRGIISVSHIPET